MGPVHFYCDLCKHRWELSFEQAFQLNNNDFQPIAWARRYRRNRSIRRQLNIAVGAIIPLDND